MSGTQAPDEPAAPPAGEASTHTSAPPTWGSLWQAPTILLSLVLIAWGIVVAMQRAPENDFDGALSEVERLLADGQLEQARVGLQETIQPHLSQATQEQRGRFHAAAADWLSAVEQAQAVRDPSLDAMLRDDYARAASLGFELSPAQRERWADASLALGDLNTARQRLEEIEAMSIAADAPEGLRHQRNRMLRKLVEATLGRDDADAGALQEALARYRRDGLLGIEDQMWAVARQAEMRLAQGRWREAVDHLLVEMRRLEPRAGEASRGAVAELHVLLGRAYDRLGALDDAAFNLNHALGLLEGSEAMAGEALEGLGQVALAQGRHEEAAERFGLVVRDFPQTPAFGPALLGRAEVQAMLGEHERSIEDYRELLRHLKTAGPRSRVTREAVARALVDRHDATLAGGRVEQALEFAQIAHDLFAGREVPPAVLWRLAASHRQIADDRRGAHPGDATARRDAGRHDALASDFALRHARAVVGTGESDAWADSLWLAADSADRSGATPAAIDLFAEYVAGRPETDPRRPAALRRLAHAYAADLQPAKAEDTFRRLIRDYPGSLEASAAFVPLAAALVELDRRPEAEQVLQEVVAGNRSIDPDASDYREALFALGRLHHEGGEHVKAIERLSEALERYGNDARIDEVRYRLADSLRGKGQALRAGADADPTLSPAERQEAQRQAALDMQQAASLYGLIKQSLGARDQERLEAVERDVLRYSYLYHADCEYLLGDYARAIELYELAAQRYPADASTMHALIQLVNAHHALGDLERARAAHRRALARLEQLPAAAFEPPAALLDRSAWERWLMNDPLGVAQADSG